MIDRSSVPEPLQAFELSAQQRRLWLLQPDGQALRAECTLRIQGDLDTGRLEAAIRRVAERHEILRTTFRRQRGIRVPFQVVADDLPALERAPAGEGMDAMVVRERRRPFDFERGPLWRAVLLAAAPREHVLWFCLPALCADAASLDNLVGDIARSYEGVEEPASEPLQYADYADWQRELLEAGDEEAERGRGFWERLDTGALASLRLPGQREPEAGSFRPAVESARPSPHLAEAVAALATRHGTSPAVPLLVCWQTLLWRLTGQPELVLGVRFEGRDVEDLRSAIGLFARWMPVTVRLEAGDCFEAVVKRVAEACREAAECQAYGGGGGQRAEPLAFPVGFELDEYPVLQTAAGLVLQVTQRYVCQEPFQIKLACARRQEGLEVELHYDADALGSEEAARLVRQFLTLLAAVVDRPAGRIGEFEILDAEERAWLATLNTTRVELGPSLPVHRRFETWAAERPQQVALVCEEQTLTYAELNRWANRLAHHLRGLGIGPEVRVALLLDRSAEAVVGLLAVLKAGGAYVPLEPAYPRQRLALMLEDTGAPVLLTRGDLAEGLAVAGLRVVSLEDEAIARESEQNPVGGEQAENLAYVLFTSGSTGRPKGVAVEHRQLAHYLDAVTHRLSLPPASGFATVSTLASDLGHTALYPALAGGGCLHLIAQERAADPQALAQYFDRYAVDCLKIVPSHLGALLAAAEEPSRLLPRRCLVLGGEACGWELANRIRRAAPDLAVWNHYGPTETTVGAATWRLDGAPDEPLAAITVPIGRPLPNVRAYLLDARLRPVPAGVTGELTIGGAGLARGYLGRPELTAERFVPDPLAGEPGVRIYRTGDLARLLPDGTLEFLGRTDQQVKIRGFRIEPGEIEAVLACHPAVAEVVVMVREDQPGEKRLAAYAVARRGQPLEAAVLRAFLRERLPEHMVPAAVVLLPALPLTPNGKVDRRALPAPERIQPERGAGFAAPRGPVEERLAAIWAEVLKLERVGIHDNFFALGGDSILSIQVVAQANRAWLHLNPRQIFQHQTIAELAAVVGSARVIDAEQRTVAGPVPLTPIQHWFFEQRLENPHHWNQAALLEVGAAEPRALERAVEALAQHHDALRLRFADSPVGWWQFHADPIGALGWGCVDLAALPDGLQGAAVESAAARLQASLHLAAGPLGKVVLFQLGGAKPSRLLLIFHHLLVDGVSWRILPEDLALAYRQSQSGGAVELPPKTTSFRRWSERLSDYARSPALAAEAELWLQAIPKRVPRLAVDRAGGDNSVRSQRAVTVALEPEETRALLQEVPAAYRTQINDVLLTALVRAMEPLTEAPALLVDLEGHGREPLFDDVDLSRTVGWFTTHFPVFFDLAGSPDPGSALRAIKERLRAVPGNGIGHGLLLYLCGGEPAARLRALPRPEIAFNYLGRFDPVLDGSQAFAAARESSGPTVDPAGARPHLLEVVARVGGGRLWVSWFYSENLHAPATIERLAGGFLAALRELVAHCQSPAAGGLSPSDFPLAGLDQERLDKILRKIAGQEG